MGGTEIFTPMIGMWILTIAVWVYMFSKRIPFINSLDLSDDDFRPAKFAEMQPPEVANPSDNLKNLFEVPLLFYAVALYLYVTQQVDTFHVVCAWIFLIFRVLHSVMHCTKNVVIVRFGFYAVASVACFVMIIRAALAQFL